MIDGGIRGRFINTTKIGRYPNNFSVAKAAIT
jgi:hypothetical protein